MWYIIITIWFLIVWLTWVTGDELDKIKKRIDRLEEK